MGQGVIVASALIRNSSGLFLVFDDSSGSAALPGGMVERGENPEETAVREAYEETGIRIRVIQLVASYQLTVLWPDGAEKVTFLHHLYLASTTDLNPQPRSEWRDSNARCMWKKLDDLGLYEGIWPLPEEVKERVSEGNMALGNLGHLKYKMRRPNLY